MTCRWQGSDRPRTIAGRHLEECRGITAFRGAADYEECRGCQPCTEPHCRICSRTHAEGTCAECLAETRANLHEIAVRRGALPEEVMHRPVTGEAMVLLAPSADPEARGHLEASVMAGRVSRESLEASHLKGCANASCTGCAGELHPEFVLLGWQMIWRDALEHDEAPDSELSTAVDYLDRTMTYMAGFAHVPFEDFNTALRQCASHLHAVLHDQNQGDPANVGCFECGGGLERRLGKEGFEDFWTCQRCRQRYTYAEYNFALRASLETAQEATA